MKSRNILLIVSIVTIILSIFVFAYDLSNIEKVKQQNTNINQSALQPGQPAPPRPEEQILDVPLSGVLLTVGLIVLAFYFAFSFLEQSFKKDLSLISTIASEGESTRTIDKDSDAQKTILNLLNPHERRIVIQLVENHGSCLQSDISRMDEMGKVKAHRYMQSLSKMGIVRIERYGNTNKIVLAENVKKIVLK